MAGAMNLERIAIVWMRCAEGPTIARAFHRRLGAPHEELVAIY